MTAGDTDSAEQEILETLVENGSTNNLNSTNNLFSVDILPIVKEAQSQHGLRHGDYQRYHGYCTRRLKRIRNCLKYKMGDKRRVTPKKVTEAIFTDSRYILLLLMSAERSWSHAMQLKQDAASDPRKRHHMVEKMRKAVVHAFDMNMLVENSDKVDAKTKLEVQAYYSYMCGILKFELKDWVSAMDLFRKTQTIYGKFSDTLSVEEQVVYRNMVDEIAPNIRYCAYTIGDQSAIDDLMHMHGSGRHDPLLAGKLDSLIAESRERKASSMSEVVWRNRVIRIKNNKVRMFLIGNKEFEQDFTKIDENNRDAQIEAYDSLLTECKDALQYIKEEIRSDPLSKSKNNEVSDLQFLHSYLTYIRLTKTVQRNMLLIEDLRDKAPGLQLAGGDTGPAEAGKKAVRPSDFIRLYDVILQNLSETLTLPGVDDDLDMKEEIDTQKLAFTAFRCFYAAQTYANEKKWTEAMALYERVLEHSERALMALSDLQDQNLVDITSLKGLMETIASNRYRVHSSAILDNLKSQDEAESDVNPSQPLCERLDVYHEYENSSLTASKAPSLSSAFPPSFQPVPCKPIYFDLALNHVKFPSLDDKLPGTKPASSRGISGLLSNIWGWGSSKS